MERLPGHPDRRARSRERRLTPIELPSWRGPTDDPARVISLVDAWAHSVALRELAASFGGLPPAHDPLPWFDAFSAAHWDFRAGRERNLARAPALTAEQVRLVFALAPALGLAGQERPARDGYDAVVMTGGMVRADLVKPRHVAAMLANGLEARTIVFLGGFRAFAGDEAEIARGLGLDAHDEFSAMVAGMQAAFGPLGEPVVREGAAATPFGSWRELRWSRGGMEFVVLAAPSSVPGERRADTADTYRFWAEQRRAPHERDVLLVTTPIYVPYQGAVAVQLLGLEHGLAVETVGTSEAANDLGEFSQVFTAAHHLQELRSAIRGMRSLRSALI